jgi:hypothetical protein
MSILQWRSCINVDPSETAGHSQNRGEPQGQGKTTKAARQKGVGLTLKIQDWLEMTANGSPTHRQWVRTSEKGHEGHIDNGQG